MQFNWYGYVNKYLFILNIKVNLKEMLQEVARS